MLFFNVLWQLVVTANVSEQGMGRWVMGHGSNGSRKSDGSHGSWVTRCWPMTHQFLILWLGLYIVAMIIHRVSLWCMCNCACDWRSSKFTLTFKFMLVGLPRVPVYPSGTRVINYPGNLLLPDGYPDSEYLTTETTESASVQQLLGSCCCTVAVQL